MGLFIQNGWLLDSTGQKKIADILIENGKIKQVADHLQPEEGDESIDATGLLVVPGFIDLHVHLREPGGEEKETIESGTMAAAKGGFTTIAAMPNTNPVPDESEKLSRLYQRIKERAKVRVFPYAAITKGQRGEELVDVERLAGMGAFAFTDDGIGVQRADVMYEAMRRAAKAKKAIVAHCEEATLTFNGSVHEGKIDKQLHIQGIPSIAESVHIARDVLLAEKARCHYHVCHISTKESVRIVKDAKKAGIHVTAEVTPHHLLLCEEDIPADDANYKMNPPLRGRDDRDALIKGLLDGTIDFIATDHAPHTEKEKSLGMENAPFGIVGLETAFPLLYTKLVVERKVITLHQLIDLLTRKPAAAFGLPYGKIEPGAPADLVLIDLEREEKVNPSTFLSKGKNTPFRGWKCKGWPERTIVEGKTVWKREMGK